jgi:hypothetical protein
MPPGEGTEQPMEAELPVVEADEEEVVEVVEEGTEQPMEAVQLPVVEADEEEVVEVGKLEESERDDDLTPKKELQEPTFFSDEKGNLKFVNTVVRRPCCIFWSILGLCILINFLLVAVVFSDGNPFTDPGSEYDVDDVRSIQYDSYRLARDEVRDLRDEAAKAEGVEPEIQSEDLDFTYWVSALYSFFCRLRLSYSVLGGEPTLDHFFLIL